MVRAVPVKGAIRDLRSRSVWLPRKTEEKRGKKNMDLAGEIMDADSLQHPSLSSPRQH